VNPARNEAIRTALAAVTSELILESDSCWRFALRNGTPHVLTAKTQDDWLVIESDCSTKGQPPALFWEALARNASLAGLAKLVLAREESLRLRAEIPLVESGDLTTRLREACSGFQAEWSHDDAQPSSALSSAGPAEPVDLKSLFTEAGWPFVERSGRKLAIELEVPGGYSQALLIPTAHGVRISCEITMIDRITDECRQAMGRFLLDASGLVRMARASVMTSGDSTIAQFEAVFGTAPSPLEISRALECLSVACSCCGEEIKALQTPAIAERYLALRADATPAIRPNERTVTP
jgi:hypothetical protein